MDPRKRFGDKGEALAAEYLCKKGMKVLSKQHKTPFGEIDLICLDGDEVVFVEVKSRKSRTFGYPEDSVTPEKIKHILASADHILQAKRWIDKPWRIDVIAIEYKELNPHVSHFVGIDIPTHF